MAGWIDGCFSFPLPSISQLNRMRKNLSTPKLRQMLDANSASDRSSASGSGLPSSVSSSHLRPTSQASQGRPAQSQSTPGMRHSSSATALHADASRQEAGGRTSEQGRDFLIEVSGVLSMNSYKTFHSNQNINNMCVF